MAFLTSIITLGPRLALRLVFFPVHIILFFIKTTFINPYLRTFRLISYIARLLLRQWWHGPNILVHILLSLDSLYPFFLTLAILGIVFGLITSLIYYGTVDAFHLQSTQASASPSLKAHSTTKQSSGKHQNSSQKRSGLLQKLRSALSPPKRSNTKPQRSPLQSPWTPTAQFSQSNNNTSPSRRHPAPTRSEMAALMSQRQEELLAQHNAASERSKLERWRQMQEQEQGSPNLSLSPRGAQILSRKNLSPVATKSEVNGNASGYQDGRVLDMTIPEEDEDGTSEDF